MNTVSRDRNLAPAYAEVLSRWLRAAVKDLYRCPDRPDLLCYGTGENGWGVQTNQKAFAAFAVMAASPYFDPVKAGMTREEVLDIALKLLRFSLESHIEGSYRCTDGTSWGHTWISALGVERMMHGVEAIEPHLTPADRDLLRRVLESECDWLLNYEVVAGLLAKDGRNKPESNLWNGAILYRTAERYPDHPKAEQYRRKGTHLFINSLSIPSDASSPIRYEGQRVSELHEGANFFESFALNHHGYLNVGYMVICLSNIAMLHFTYRRLDRPAPASLYHHLEELWQLVKACTFPDGRLLRIGGDTRVRYTYCQDYAVPTWLLIRDWYGDEECRSFEEGWLRQVRTEMDANGDGYFLSERCRRFREQSPLYWTRLESDRAVTLSMGLAWADWLQDRPATASANESAVSPADSPGTAPADLSGPAAVDLSGSALADLSGGDPVDSSAEASADSPGAASMRSPASSPAAASTDSPPARLPLISWHDEYHGAYLHRSAKRIASWTWEAGELPQGLCLPPTRSDLAEWRENLAGAVSGLGKVSPRRLLRHEGRLFSGGFVTWGSTMVRTEGLLGESQQDHDIARIDTVCAALPDDTHMLVLQYAQAVNRRIYLSAVKGLHLLIPNDVFNGHRRDYYYEHGGQQLQGAGGPEEVLTLNSRWLNVEDQLGVIAVYGSDSLAVYRPGDRQIGLKRTLKNVGAAGTLYCDEICGPLQTAVRSADAGAVLLDAGYVLQAGEDRRFTQNYAKDPQLVSSIDCGNPDVRGICMQGKDARRYMLAANFGETVAEVPLSDSGRIRSAGEIIDWATGRTVQPDERGMLSIRLAPGQAALLAW